MLLYKNKNIRTKLRNESFIMIGIIGKNERRPMKSIIRIVEHKAIENGHALKMIIKENVSTIKYCHSVHDGCQLATNDHDEDKY